MRLDHLALHNKPACWGLGASRLVPGRRAARSSTTVGGVGYRGPSHILVLNGGLAAVNGGLAAVNGGTAAARP